jgi:hypothetical protein
MSRPDKAPPALYKPLSPRAEAAEAEVRRLVRHEWFSVVVVPAVARALAGDQPVSDTRARQVAFTTLVLRGVRHVFRQKWFVGPRDPEEAAAWTVYKAVLPEIGSALAGAATEALREDPDLEAVCSTTVALSLLTGKAFLRPGQRVHPHVLPAGVIVPADKLQMDMLENVMEEDNECRVWRRYHFLAPTADPASGSLRMVGSQVTDTLAFLVCLGGPDDVGPMPPK